MAIMKTTKSKNQTHNFIAKFCFATLGLLMTMCMIATAQNLSMPTAAVLGIDSRGVEQDAESVSYMVRLELEKANTYSMMDRYDVAEAVKKNNIDIRTCLGKSCVVMAGKVLHADKMITGSVERFA